MVLAAEAALDAFIDESQRFVTGEVRLRLEPGRCYVVGRRSEHSLYDYGLATYESADTFNHADSEGFVRLWGLGLQTWSAKQGPGSGPDPPGTTRAGGRRMSTLWHGRFEGGPAEELMAFTVSLPFDQRAGRRRPGRVAGPCPRAWCGPACSAVVEADAVLAALDQVGGRAGRRHASCSWPPTRTSTPRSSAGSPRSPGPAGAKLHTGRSRNDQVATDLRLFTKRELLAESPSACSALQQVLVDRAAEAGDAYLPGYTHLQRAQPVLLAHHLLAHGWALARDVDRLLDCRRRLDVSPLGAGALAGSSLPLDPAGVAADLGFAAVFENSLDAVSDRDFVAEALFVPDPDRPAPVAASARRSSCGRAPSSGSCAWPTRTPPAARCCRRRRTPTSPSWPGARAGGSSAT